MTAVDLSTWQKGMLAAIARRPQDAPAGAATVVADVLRSSRQSSHERLDVYSRSYFTRLVDTLRSVFPALRAALGDELFDGFAVDYVRSRPSRSWSLGELGSDLDAHLAATRPAAHDRRSPDWTDLLCDLARYEWAIAEVFDGPGSEGRPSLKPEHLVRLSPARLRRIRIGVTPSLRLIELRFPVEPWYSALIRPAAGPRPQPPSRPAASCLALWRRNFVVRREEISAAQRDLLAALRHRRTLAEAIAGAVRASPHRDDELASSLTCWFRAWGAAGIFESVS
jgi:hypothetical protein